MGKKRMGRPSRGFKMYSNVVCFPATMKSIDAQCKAHGLSRADGIRFLLDYGAKENLIDKLFQK